jgi:hypothetical protein
MINKIYKIFLIVKNSSIYKTKVFIKLFNIHHLLVIKEK